MMVVKVNTATQSSSSSKTSDGFGGVVAQCSMVAEVTKVVVVVGAKCSMFVVVAEAVEAL